jgi:hypothetical protein
MAYSPKNPNGQATMANSTPVVIASDQSAVPTSLASVPSHPVTNAGTFAVQVTSAPTTAVTGTFWQATQPVSIAATVTTAAAANSTGTQSNPSLSNVSATLLASNAARKGATVYNNSASIVYVRLSATAASATTFTVKLNPTDYYEVPGFYSGALTAILDTGTTTAVQVTEIT